MVCKKLVDVPDIPIKIRHIAKAIQTVQAEQTNTHSLCKTLAI